MRGTALLLLALLIVATVPAPAAASGVWKVDSTLSLVDGKAREIRRVTYDATVYSPTWRIPVPAHATFVEAHDAQGTLPVTKSASEVTITTRGKGASYSFFVIFDATPQEVGPFRVLVAQVSAAPDSPVTVSTSLPAGWSRAGWRASGNLVPDASGVFRATGPVYVETLALAAGFADADPDKRVQGNGVLREANVTLSASGGTLELTHVYDADVYSRDWTVAIPPRATFVEGTTPFGALAVTEDAGKVRFQTPYPTGYHLGGRSFTLRFALAAPDAYGGPFRQANVSVPAAVGDAVTVRVRLDEGHVFTGAQAVDAVEVSPLVFRASGPTLVRVGFLPPTPAGFVRFEEPPFVVEAPAPLEAAARATARNASQLLPSVTAFLGAVDRERPFYVAYTDAKVFGWEEGFYTPGLNTVSIRASDLDAATTTPRLRPVTTLVHEATHGLIDRAFPHGPDNLSFVQEGLARLAETHVERHFPDQVVSCSGNRCTRHSARPDAAELHAYYRAGASFDPTWRTSTVPEERRAFFYHYSGMLFHHYEQSVGPESLRVALRALALSEMGEDDAADAREVVETLLAYAEGMDEERLLHPGRALAQRLSAEEFQSCMGSFVAPGYPFQPRVAKPAAGCPGLEPLPQAPPQEPEPVVTTPTPVAKEPEPVVPTPPALSQAPTPVPSTQEPDATPTEAPPVDAEPVGRASAPQPATRPTPGPALPLALVALAAALALTRRK